MLDFVECEGFGVEIEGVLVICGFMEVLNGLEIISRVRSVFYYIFKWYY